MWAILDSEQLFFKMDSKSFARNKVCWGWPDFQRITPNCCNVSVRWNQSETPVNASWNWELSAMRSCMCLLARNEHKIETLHHDVWNMLKVRTSSANRNCFAPSRTKLSMGTSWMRHVRIQGKECFGYSQLLQQLLGSQIDGLEPSDTETKDSLCNVPRMLISDNDLPFTSKEFKNITKSWNFEHKAWSLGYPRANGKAESAVTRAKMLPKKKHMEATQTHKWHLLVNETHHCKKRMVVQHKCQWVATLKWLYRQLHSYCNPKQSMWVK